MKSEQRSIVHVTLLLLVAAGVTATTISIFRSRAVLAEARLFSEAAKAWESESRYHNPLDRRAMLLSFAPECGSCRIEIEELAALNEPALPIVGISVNPYPESPLEFAGMITGQRAARLQLLYGLTLDSVIVVGADGAVIDKKSPQRSTTEFYIAALEAAL